MERLQHYFTANDILAEDKRRAILLTVVGASTYRLIRTLVVMLFTYLSAMCLAPVKLGFLAIVINELSSKIVVGPSIA